MGTSASGHHAEYAEVGVGLGRGRRRWTGGETSMFGFRRLNLEFELSDCRLRVEKSERHGSNLAVRARCATSRLLANHGSATREPSHSRRSPPPFAAAHVRLNSAAARFRRRHCPCVYWFVTKCRDAPCKFRLGFGICDRSSTPRATRDRFQHGCAGSRVRGCWDCHGDRSGGFWRLVPRDLLGCRIGDVCNYRGAFVAAEFGNRRYLSYCDWNWRVGCAYWPPSNA
jgi:hypothetical protein